MTNESIAKSFDDWLKDPMTHWSGDKDAAYQAWLHVHETVVEGLIADNSSLRGSLKSYSVNMKKQIRASGKIERERDALKAELAWSESDSRSQAEEILRLKAEREELRKDAERYRWLRRGENYAHQYLIDLSMERMEGFDKAIDAAMGQGGQSNG